MKKYYYFFAASLFSISLISKAGPGDSGHQHGHHDQIQTGHHGHAGHHADGHHGSQGHGKSLAGRPGNASKVNRVIKVEANDQMEFVHPPLKIKPGETIEFEITNKGKIPHEFSIGTKSEHIAHSKMMMANPNMHHGPGGASITIAPGETQTLIWSFEEASHVEVACNIPGHYEAGMHRSAEFVD